MKNAIVIPTYNSLLKHKNYNTCVNTWKYYCKQHDIDLILLEGEKLHNSNLNDDKNDYALMCYDRWLDVNISENDYDRVTFVDADTIVRWDAFDINQTFKGNNLDIVVVHDQGGPGVPEYHLNQWLGFKPNIYSFVKGYFNAGFVSMKVSHLKEFQKAILPYKEYYYTEKDINCHVRGIGKIGGVRIDAMDQTAVNIALQELFPDKITFVSKIFNCQVPYLFKDNQDFINNYKNFDFLNEGVIFHLGSGTLAYTNFMDDFWNNFKEYYI
jgi:hypothetical protein